MAFSKQLTSAVPTSPLDDALMAANDGLNRSLVDVFRTRSNVGTEPFFGIPIEDHHINKYILVIESNFELIMNHDVP